MSNSVTHAAARFTLKHTHTDTHRSTYMSVSCSHTRLVAAVAFYCRFRPKKETVKAHKNTANMTGKVQ